MKTVAVIGAGAMGSGIAQVAAMHGAEVLLYDHFSPSVVKARDTISQSLSKLAAKGKITDQEATAVFGRIYFVEQLSSLASADLMIEAIVEEVGEKEKLFQWIADHASPKTIVGTNTSALSVTRLAKSMSHPERFAGIHFFNPPVLMPLVEIIPALQTSPDVVQWLMATMREWNKVPVRAMDTPGFIVNRIARPFYGEALRMAEEGLAKPEEIDAAMKSFGQFKMGPFELMDFIGHDVNYAVTTAVWKAMYFDARYTPSPLQARLVDAGWLGRKTGRGFYAYDGPSGPPEIVRREEHRFIFDRVLVMLINEAAEALYRGIASREDIELAMTLGVQYPRGLLHWADAVGLPACVEQMDRLYQTYHEDRYRCSVLLREMVKNGQTFFA